MNFLNLRAINKDSYEWWVVSLLALPVYFFILIDNHPYAQFVCYLGYLLALTVTFMAKKTFKIPISFILGWFLFLILLMVPSYINQSSGRLESEMINLTIITVKMFLLTSILCVMVDWAASVKPNQSFDFYPKLFIVIAPMSIILILAILTPHILYPDKNVYPIPYGMQHNYLGETLILFTLLATQMRASFLKYLSILFALIAIFYLSSRSTLLGSLVGVVLITVGPLLKKHLKPSLIFVGLFILSLPLTYPLLYEIADFLFLLSSKSRGFEAGITGRWFDYLRGIDLLREHWLLGVGYDASIPFNSRGNENVQIHNFLLRILTENGIGLFLFILGLMMAAAIRIERLNLNFERGCFYALIAAMMFQPRHINLNLMSVFFYIVLIRALYAQPSKGSKRG